MNDADKLLRDACLSRVQWAALMAWATTQDREVYEQLQQVRRSALAVG